MSRGIPRAAVAPGAIMCEHATGNYRRGYRITIYTYYTYITFPIGLGEYFLVYNVPKLFKIINTYALRPTGAGWPWRKRVPGTPRFSTTSNKRVYTV